MSETNESGQAPGRDHASTPDTTDTTDTPFLPDGDPSGSATALEADPLIPDPEAGKASEADPPGPANFAELGLEPTLQDAVAALGWRIPTPVQAKTFGPMAAGADVLVQSHTGSGKTGAFCLPWLATRFQPGPAKETGVQLLVLLPTRELAKQVCTELVKLAVESPVEVLPVYGGTAIVPQFDALRRGVHAVVGTPGRILDHIRRRSLDLSKVRTAVLDECDEMLSMGFLEDIRAILETCPRERQTCLFSATVPTDIARIAKRYMRDPVRVELSGDQVAAAEIDHAYYQASSSIKTRDLLDLIMVEDPTRAIVFCNTREEVKLVASVLQREGYSAEMLSGDLTQAQRERVMGAMREHRMRFLVATDVAARGIDISDISHVINYSFPESPDVYVHRTGRTGRAGRPGIALSVIASTEVGNFYMLKKLHPSITFEERSLPPAEELTAQRVEVKLDTISQLFPELVSPEWTMLARSLMKDPRGERVIAFLLSEAMRQAEGRRRPREFVEVEESAGESEQDAQARRARERRERYDREDRRDEEDAGRRRRRGRGGPGRDGERPSERPGEHPRERPRERGRTTDEPREVPEPRRVSEPERAEVGPPGPTEATRPVSQPGVEGDSDGGVGKRRRRRRRRGRGRPDGAPPEHSGQESAPAETDGETDPDAGERTDRDVAPPSSAPGDDEGDGKRRRRRRRRKPRADASAQDRARAATSAASTLPPPPPSKVSQESIVIDIDELELEVVRTEFGDIDELGDLTLKGRRRAVMDELQDEVVLEDMSGADAVRWAAEEEDEEDEGDENGGDETGQPEAGATRSIGDERQTAAAVEPAGGTPAEDEAAAKKRRRRRRKKKPAPVAPELTAPPHKDFWEVWAAKYTTKDFERETDALLDRDEPPAPPRPIVSEPEETFDDSQFVRVRLNIGRAHGKKSAAVRDLLADRSGLRGKAVRDLTVREQDTFFRMPESRFDEVAALLRGQTLAGVALAVERVDEQGVALRVEARALAGAEEAATAEDALAVAPDDDPASDQIPST